MRFKTKDLLVSVTPNAEVAEADLAKLCAFHTYVCFSPTWCAHQTCRFPSIVACQRPCSFLASYQYAECPGGSRYGFFDPTIFIRDREDIAKVREQLHATLAQLDEVEKVGLSGDIRTKAEAEALEAGLKEALEQVQAAKKKLR